MHKLMYLNTCGVEMAVKSSPTTLKYNYIAKELALTKLYQRDVTIQKIRVLNLEFECIFLHIFNICESPPGARIIYDMFLAPLTQQW